MADVADMVHDFGSVSFVTPFGRKPVFRRLLLLSN